MGLYSDREFEEILKQRDELAAALKLLVDEHWVDDQTPTSELDALEKARALLARMDTGTEPRPSSVK